MENQQDFTQGSIAGKMLRFMVPILGALVLQAMYGAVDLLIVGRFGTSEGISGVATGSSVISLFTFTFAALSTAVTVLIGQHLGAKRTDKLGEVIGNAVLLFGTLAVVFSLLLYFFARPLAVMMQAPEEALDVTVEYIQICGGGFFFVMMYNLISSIFRGFGNSKLPLLFVLAACIVNIVGDLVLVAGFQMNVAGAAIATVAAQAVSVMMSLLVILKRKRAFSFKKEDFRFGPQISAILRIGLPLALMEFLTQASFLAVCAFINRIGLDASSGYGVAQKVTSFIMLLPSSLLQCMSPFVAQNVGAGKEDRSKAGMRCGILIGVIFGASICVIVFLFGRNLAGLFTTNTAYIAKAYEYLCGFVADAIVTSISFSFCGYFNGHGKSMFVMIQGLIQSLGIRLPLAFAVSGIPGVSLMYIGIAVPIASSIGVIMCLFYYRYLNKDGGRRLQNK